MERYREANIRCERSLVQPYYLVKFASTLPVGDPDPDGRPDHSSTSGDFKRDENKQSFRELKSFFNEVRSLRFYPGVECPKNNSNSQLPRSWISYDTAPGVPVRPRYRKGCGFYLIVQQIFLETEKVKQRFERLGVVR